MIEFTPDGPFSEKANQLFPGRVRVLGLGQTGAAVCDQLVLHGRPQQDLWVFDSDQSSIEGSVVPNRRLLGRNLVHGLGCSGDVDLAREIVAMEEANLANVANACDFLILVLGLSGGTSVALAEHFIALGHEAGAKVIVVGVQPFAFEGIARRERAIQAIADLRAEADSVLVMASDRIADDPATQRNIRHGFHLMHQQLAHTVQALSQIVCKRGLIQLSFADVRALYARYTGSEVLENCWVAHVNGDMHDRTEDLVAELLNAPMLTDEGLWKRVDHAIVAVSGSRDLGLAEVQELVSLFKERLPVSVPIATSASLEDDGSESVRMTVLLATTAPARLSVPELAANFEKPPRKKKVSSDTVPLPAYPTTAPSVADVVDAAEVADEPPAEPPVLPAKKISRKPMPVAPPEPIVEPLVPAEEEMEAAVEEELTHPVAAMSPSPSRNRSSSPNSKRSPWKAPMKSSSHRPSPSPCAHAASRPSRKRCNSSPPPAAVSRKRTRRSIAAKISTSRPSAGVD
jgi:cell division protein FtsZ